MKIPKTFISSDKKEIDPSKIEITTMGLEDLIPKSVNGMNCEEKIVTEFVNNYYLYDNELIDKLVQTCCIDIYQLNRMAVVKYDKCNKKIALMEYKKQRDLINRLQEISEYLDTYYMTERRDFLKKRLFSKNNILVWIDGDKCFIESTTFHYKSLGFEPFN